MAKLFEEITPDHKEFIERQHVFFVGTAAAEGRINISPKGMDSLRVTGPNQVVWLNLTGSGNETAAHLLRIPRMTIMFCSFEQDPLILRLYGEAQTFHPNDQKFAEYKPLFPDQPGTRQILEMKVDLVQTSCGYAVPFMEFQSDRTQLNTWAAKKDDSQLHAYWEKKNMKSIDGFETGMEIPNHD